MLQDKKYNIVLKSNLNEILFSYLLFFIWPFIAVIVSLKNNRQLWSKNIIWFFVAFYGYNFVIPNEGADGFAYQERFIEIAHTELSSNSFSEYLYGGENGTVDIIEPIISYTLAQFTDNPQILFGVYGIIFGFFYSRNLWFLLSHNYKWSYTNFIIFILFAFSIGIWEINGFRFWCSCHIFFYGAFPFIMQGKKKYIIFILLSAFMHFSFLFPIAILALYYFAGNRVHIYFIFFLITFFIAELNVSAVREILTLYLPDIFSTKIEAYTSDVYIDVVEERSANVTIFNTLSKYMGTFIRVAMLLIVYFNYKKIKNSKPLNSLLSFTLLFYGFANIFQLIPSGGRFISAASLFVFSLYFIYTQYSTSLFARRFVYVASPLILYVVFYNFKIIAKDTFSLYTFSNPLLNSIF